MKKVIIWTFGILILLFVLFPVVWALKIAVSSKVELTLLPTSFTFDNFTQLFGRSEFLIYFRNSSIVSILCVVLTILISIPAAYALARFQFRGKKLSFLLLVFPLLPSISILVPLVSYFNSLGLYDSIFAVIIANIVFSLPFSIWMIRNYILTITYEIEEAALLDGCSHFKIIFRITIPIMLPGVIATSVFIFMGAWNNYLFSYALTSSQNLRVLPQGILSFLGSWGTQWGGLTAAGIITLLPPIMFFLIFQKWFIRGIIGGSSK
jgi:multiple sugar transport system permease protein